MIKKVLISIVAIYIAVVFILETTIVVTDLIGGLENLKEILLQILNKISFNNL
jgi:hypothetical protein